MSNQTHVVIGANYGDEGKGLVTDYLCHQMISETPMTFGSSSHRTLNIRHNGGAQAGHSVYHDGSKHVFGHLGAGMCQPNVDTWLTRDFIVNPFLFMKEYIEFRHNRWRTLNVFVSDECLVTTPFDVMRNQISATLTSTISPNHRDTVGVGIFETIKRNRESKFRLMVEHLRHVKYRDYVKKVLHLIAEDVYTWFEDTISCEVKNGFTPPVEWGKYFTRLQADVITSNFLHTANYFVQATFSDKELRGNYTCVIFEGAQGLALSQSNMYERDGELASALYALTPSFTGVENVVSLVNDELPSREANLSTIDTKVHLHYVTRAYFTRHGRGEFPSELSKNQTPLVWTIRDSTNKYHEYQGVIRIGYFHSDEMFRRIKEDLTKISSNKVSSITLHMNFLDQTGDNLYDTSDTTCVIVPKEKVGEYLIDIAQRRHGIFLNEVVFHDTAIFEPHVYIGLEEVVYT